MMVFFFWFFSLYTLPNIELYLKLKYFVDNLGDM